MEPRARERGPSGDQPRSWTARILAPLMLAAVAAAIVLVVSGTLSGGDDGDDETEQGSKRGVVLTCDQPEAEGAIEAGYYVVEPEEDLTVVAERTCIPLDRLIKLNRNLDPQAIPVGGCISLRREACKELSEG